MLCGKARTETLSKFVQQDSVENEQEGRRMEAVEKRFLMANSRTN
jgi:hypothetical protein